MNQKELYNKCRGSLVAGAAGDALGYPVEFLRLDMIHKRFGDSGITEYVSLEEVAEISDDTQMTLFTAEGLLNAFAKDNQPQLSALQCNVAVSYLYWYRTQGNKFKSSRKESWLVYLKDLWACRAPGNTCLSSLKSIVDGRDNFNASKGCGGIMRVAPVAIYAASHKGVMSLREVGKFAGCTAFITHDHPLSTLSTAMFSMIQYMCLTQDGITKELFEKFVLDSFELTRELYPKEEVHLSYLKKVVDNALTVAKFASSDEEVLPYVGDGWVAEETLAIALFSVLRHIDSVEDCLVCAVNHGGDSDSTGAVAGNLIGAILGHDAIPAKFLDRLELRDIIETVADDLCASPDSPDDSERLKKRYKEHLPFGIPAKYLNQ